MKPIRVRLPPGIEQLSDRAIFLDRDGLITRRRRDYVKSVKEVEILPGAPETLGMLPSLGFKLIIVTNQSMVNRGLSTRSHLAQIHRQVAGILADKGCRIDAIYYCPHRADEKCGCRKPRIGLILKAAKEHRLDLSKSWLLGDEQSDVEAGRRAGCRTLKIRTNEPSSLRRAVMRIVGEEGHRPAKSQPG